MSNIEKYVKEHSLNMERNFVKNLQCNIIPVLFSSSYVTNDIFKEDINEEESYGSRVKKGKELSVSSI